MGASGVTHRYLDNRTTEKREKKQSVLQSKAVDAGLTGTDNDYFAIVFGKELELIGIEKPY